MATSDSGFKISITIHLWALLSIPMIVIGSMHIDNCPVEPKIPIFLIVAGIFHLLAFLLSPLKKVNEKLSRAIEGIIGLFSLCWFIAGSVWVFRVYQYNPRHCNDMLYKFAFGILIAQYIFLAIIVAVFCLCALGIGTLMGLNKDTSISFGNRSVDDEEPIPSTNRSADDEDPIPSTNKSADEEKALK